MHNQPNPRSNLLNAAAPFLFEPGELEWAPPSSSARALDHASCNVMEWAYGTPAQSTQLAQRTSQTLEPTDPNTKVYDQLVALKVNTSSLAMHLTGAWRAGLFRQLDHLLDPDEWDFADKLPTVPSFQTFLRLVIALGHTKRPALGASADGNLISAWVNGRDRLTVECLPNDMVRWVVVQHIGGERISVAGRNPTYLLKSYLAPYNPGAWFDG